MYVPDRGDVVWLSFDPQVGREQAGRRPALVLSPKAYNGKVGLILCCPITNRAKGYPFEVPIPDEAEVTGVICPSCAESGLSREARQITRLPAQTLNEVLARIEALLRD